MEAMRPWDEMESLAGEHRKFTPRPTYDRDGDSVTLYLDADVAYRERIDAFVTVYRSMKTQKVTGFQLKNVSQVMAKTPGIGIDIESRGVSLGLLLLSAEHAQKICAGDDVTVRMHRYLELYSEVLPRTKEMEVKLSHT